MMNALKKKLDFAKPPVEEVILGVLFKPLDRFFAPHLGEIWQEFKELGFVHTTAQGAIPPTIESFSDQIPEPHVQISNVPDFGRLLFIHENEDRILQIQRDRFTFNWRKIEGGQKYPGFSAIFTMFEDFCTRFRDNLQHQGIGDIIPLQYELGYINQLLRGDGWNTLGDIGKIYQMFADSQQSDSFWSGAESVILQTSFPITDLQGRLHLAISNRVKIPEQQQTLQTDFTLRGFSQNEENAMGIWFKSARDQILEKFTTMFTDDIQTRVWERK